MGSEGVINKPTTAANEEGGDPPFDGGTTAAQRLEMAGELVVMDARSQAIAVFQPQRDILARFREKYGPDVIVQYDLTTTKGDAAARADRLELVTARTSLDKRRKALNEADQERINARNEVAKSIVSELAPFEVAVDEAIKADEKRRADAKAEADRIKREAEERIAGAINTIRNVLVDAVGKPSVELLGMEAELREMVIESEAFGIRYGEAVSAKDHVLGKLAEMIERTLLLEAREHQARADEERRQAEAAEQAKRDEEARKAELKRQADLAAENEARAARLAEEERLLAERRQKLEEEEAAARKRRQDAEDAERADRQRKEDEARAEKQRQEDAERVRVREIRDRIEALFVHDLIPAGATAAVLEQHLSDIQAQPVEFAGDLIAEAAEAKAHAVTTLTKALEAARVSEAAAELRRIADVAAAAARKKADEEAAAERARQAEELVQKQARASYLAENAEEMVEALSAVADDPSYHLLTEDTTYLVDRVRKAVAVLA